MALSTQLIGLVRTSAVLGILVGTAAPLATATVGRPPDIRDAAASVQGSVPDVLERYAAAHPYGDAQNVSRPPDVADAASAAAADVPDVFERATVRAQTGQGGTATRPDDRAGPLGVGEPTFVSVPGDHGFDWGDWTIGLLAGLGLASGLAGALLLLMHRAPRARKTGVAAAG
jgi:uncharacterized iron-regulated membrane protein